MKGSICIGLSYNDGNKRHVNINIYDNKDNIIYSGEMELSEFTLAISGCMFQPIDTIFIERVSHEKS